ncbi:hypothetical protein NKH33_31400 [Mesorhizobium sp. M1182]|uniref:hypothetical protein n=1 Tax=Mesorhizobium sp. M1182 TaxID=2957067 RepID=UPI00333A79B0
MDTVKILNAQLLKSEEIIASFYLVLDSSSGLPAPKDLKRLHTQLNSEIAKLIRIVRDQPETVKLATKAAHLKVHRALKLLGGDLFLVDLEVARAAPPPAPGGQGGEEELVRAAFGKFLREWVAASPLIHPDTAQKLWPNIRNYKALAGARVIGESFETSPFDPKPVSPLELARDAVKRELRRVNLNDPILSDETVHLVGMAYVLGQVELAMRFQNDQSYQRYVSDWYEVAKRPMAAIVETVGCLDPTILQTVRDGDPFSLDWLQRFRRDLLATLALFYSVPDWPCATLAGFPKPSGHPSEIVGVNNVTEKTTLRNGLAFDDVPANRQDMLGYLADTGFPLIYPRRGVMPPNGPPKRFGRLARAILVRSRRQAFEYLRQIRFSVSETICEQQELIADLLAIEAVRDAFRGTVQKEPRLNLIDRKSRGKALTAAMRSFAGQLSHDQALLLIIGFIDRYLHYFTRHTGDNMRDEGKNYLSSAWPTDLNGRQFMDCGIYAVETAFDLMRIAQAARGMTLRFRFLLIPEHVALVIYHEETSFCVNNADVAVPRRFPQGAVDREAAAGLGWAPDITQPLYDARFAIVVAALSPKSFTSRTSEGLFTSSIWATYKSHIGFGVTQAVRQDFFETLKSFDAGCALLCGYLIEILRIEPTVATEKELATDLDAATALADHLYRMIQVLAHPLVYSDDNALGLISTVMAHVSIDDALVQRTRLNRRLPVYRFIEMLKQVKSPTPVQQQLIARNIDGAHIDELNLAFKGGGTRSKQDFQTLQSMLGSARSGVLPFVRNAPPRVLALVQRP